MADNPEAAFESLPDGEWTVFVFEGEVTLAHAWLTVANGQDQHLVLEPTPAKN